jgi:aerobic-type carbon monoxide dehydrogenase small subunit (CoxS/CutS family)
MTSNQTERRQAARTVRVDMSALDMLREVVGLTGTKYGCGEGECGACTILVDGVSLNSCLMFAVDCHGRELVTIEDCGRRKPTLRGGFVEHRRGAMRLLHPGMVMQRAIARGASGCRCRGHQARHRRQPLPLHRLQENQWKRLPP